MKSVRIIAISALTLLLGACGRDVVEVTSDLIPAVELSASSVGLLPGGSCSIGFTVSGVPDGDLAFNLRLRGGGEPGEFRLAGVTRGSGPGQYIASIEDAGTGKSYSREVCVELAVRDKMRGARSEYICVNCGETVYGEAPDTGLPTVYIDTGDGAGAGSFYASASSVLKIRGSGSYGGTAPASCTVSLRGNISQNLPKKPYKVHFRDSVPLLGMPAHGDWVLLANFTDRTLMRNMVAMKVSSLTSLAWTPRCVPVELMFNGEHRGSYLLIEQVAVAPDRLDISAEGYLLELDFHFDNEFQWTDRHGSSTLFPGGIPFAVKYPDPGQLSAQRKDYIRDYVTRASDALYGDEFTSPEKGYAAYLDADSFADYWLVYELLGNVELYSPGSVYMHKEAGGKLVAGPCWDFDWCLTKSRTDTQLKTGLLNTDAIWYARLFNDPAFKEKVRARFAALLPSLRTVPDYIDSCKDLLSESAALNFAMWNPAEDRWQHSGMLINGDEKMSFEDAAAQLKTVYLQRLEFLSEKLL